MKFSISLLFLFFNLLLFGQFKNPTKVQVLALIDQTNAEKANGLDGKWWTANNDSSFYKSDTIQFFNNENVSDTKQICHFQSWEFRGSGKLLQLGGNNCQEPPTIECEVKQSTRKGKSVFITPYPDSFSITEINNKAFLQTFKNGKPFDKYLVLGLQKITFDNNRQTSDIITLVRQKIVVR